MAMGAAPNKCQLISEIGLSHEGSLGFAFKFIEASQVAGADIVKFQYHIPSQESSNKEEFRIKFSLQDESRWNYWDRTSFTPKEWELIVKECEAQKIEFCVSVFSKKAASMMLDLGVRNIKLGSGDFSNLELREFFYDWKGNLFLSTGLATFSEIQEVIEFFKQSKLNRLLVFQCTTKYPTPYNQVGINTMIEIRDKFDVQVGLSDHSNGIDSSIVAICNGASAIEKHVTFSKAMFGPDISSSVTFEELARLATFRDNFVDIMTPINKDQVTNELKKEKVLFGRSLGLNRSIKAGTRIDSSDFCLRKPSGGLTWEDRMQLVGKRLKRDIELDELLIWDDFE